MDEKHPENLDPRPKRRKDQDNPYSIFSTGADAGDGEIRFYLAFRDGQGVQHCMEISKELFALFDRFELDDLSHLNEVDNHYEHSELTEASMNQRALHPQQSVEEMVLRNLQNEMLHTAIATLPRLQRRRLVLHFFGNLTYEQIGEMEGCTKVAVKHSIDKAILALRNFFEKNE